MTNNSKPMTISFTFSIRERGEYGGGTTKLSMTISDDMVPQGIDAVSYLRSRINSEFNRVTGQTPISQETPEITVNAGPEIPRIPATPGLS